MGFHIPFELLLLTSSVGALQSAFFSFYLFSKKNIARPVNTLLAFLLLLFAIRMAKSVSYYFAEGHRIPLLLQNIGYAAHAAIMPVLWLYVNAFVKKSFRFASVANLLHLGPALLILLLSPVLSSRFWLAQNVYGISLAVLPAYLPACVYLIHTNKTSLNEQQKKWIYGIVVSIAIVWFAYMANYLFRWVSYITAPVLFSFSMYSLSYIGLKYPSLFIRETKYKSSAFTDQEITACFHKLQLLMSQEALYKNPLLTLPKLAKHLSVSPNLLSQSVNEKAGMNVPDFINSYRIKEAQNLLANPDTLNQKIASIAFDTGFNALSAFNAAFKKFTGTTPSEYRKKQNP